MAPGVARTLNSRLVGVTETEVTPRTVCWNGTRRNAPEIPTGVRTADTQNPASSSASSVMTRSCPGARWEAPTRVRHVHGSAGKRRYLLDLLFTGEGGVGKTSAC